MDTYLYRRQSDGVVTDARGLQRAMPLVGAPHCLTIAELDARGWDLVAVVEPDPFGEGQAYGEAELVEVEGEWRIVTPVIDLPAPEPVVVLPAEVKAEAERRIVAVCPEWRQRNLTARAVELTMQVAGGATLDAGEQAEWDAGLPVWQEIKRLRARSDEIEAMDPIPADFRDDAYWAAPE